MASVKTLIKTRLDLLLYFLLAGLIVFSICFERMPLENMLAFDGGGYLVRSQHLGEMLSNNEISAYHIQRIFTSFLVWSFGKLFSIELTVNFVVNAFIVINIIAIIISIYYYEKICRLLRFDMYIKSVGIILAFFTFPVLKMSFYYPVLNDTAALATGFIMINQYLNKNIISLFIITIIGSFIFPTFFYIGFLLILFTGEAEFTTKEFKGKWMVYGISIGLVLLYIAWELYIFVYKTGTIERYNLSSNSPIQKNLFPFSLIICCLYLIYVTVIFLGNNNNLRYILHSIQLKLLIYLIGLIFFIKTIQTIFASNNLQSFSQIDYFFTTIRHSISNPFKFVVSHFVYYGLLIPLIILMFKPWVNSIKNLGIGYKLVVLFCLLLAINPESRQLINFFPFLIIPFLSSIPQMRKYKIILLFIFVTNLLLSRFWYPMNIKTPFYGAFNEFPWQHYFMTQGPWMSTNMYYLQTVILIVTLIITYFFIRNSFSEKSTII